MIENTGLKRPLGTPAVRFTRFVKRLVERETLGSNTAGLRWHLDFPDSQRSPWILPGGWVVQGWLVLPDSLAEWVGKVEIVARWGKTFELSHPLSIRRPDVIEAIFGTETAEHPQVQCGFRFTVPHFVDQFSLFIRLGDDQSLLTLVEMSHDHIDKASPPTIKVLEGKQGWLFLDNDTNGSVDQYRGRLRLTDEGISQWQKYLQGVTQIANSISAAHAVLVAPSKESVMGPHYHPFAEGSSGPIQQLLALPEARNIVYPQAHLAQLGDGAFIRTDTHWTQQGAMVATKALAVAMSLDPGAVDAVFAKDKYKQRKFTGDLGNKFTPERHCNIQTLSTFNFIKYRHFDNCLPNFGRLMLVVNEQALIPEICLIFGSSSSYSMMNYVCRLFKQVVFVHSAGTLDPELIKAVNPAYLVVQTNARFVVQVPGVKQSLLELIHEKRARLSKDERASVAKRRIDVEPDDVLVHKLNLIPWLV
ncbi:MAG: alginate O-acetyltransferase AlgX-related protein [Halomonadaceae bacterium]|uniref:AlgX/AlgJ SGNH hydrolase-like domain-containing protein n=1 Tax=Halomonas colorata TaxID=2742615 RepID=A0ABR9G259_9GAMM|nr:hypothetical protein [Halomonas colorata]MBE0465000.1 hypothetical protein [Halomonas colorata]